MCHCMCARHSFSRAINVILVLSILFIRFVFYYDAISIVEKFMFVFEKYSASGYLMLCC